MRVVDLEQHVVGAEASSTPNADGSSIEQNQKLRRSTSLGRRSPFHAPPSWPDAGVVEDVVGPVGEHVHPADAALDRRCAAPGSGCTRPTTASRRARQ